MRLTIGGVIVNILRIVLTVIFVIDCIGLTVVVLMADTYWGQNKGRSMEGHLVLATKIMAILFMVLAIVLNMKF